MITKNSITAHRQGGFSLPIAKQDSTGAVIDLTSKVYKFKTKSGLDLTLAVDPNNSKGKVLVLTEANMQTIPAGTSTDFVLLDTTADPDIPLWSGRLTVTGW